MQPPRPEPNPVEQGLLELGRHIEEQRRAAKRTPRAGAARGRGTHAAPRAGRRWQRLGWVAGSLFLVMVLLAGAAAGYGWYLNREIHRIDLKNLTSAPTKGADAGTET